MYRHLYGLKDKPFQISTDPSFLWLGPKHKEALAVLVYGVRNSKGFLLLSGGVGTGKTTLIRALLGQLDKKVTVATVHDPGLTHMDFFNFIATAYGMRKRYTNKVDFLFDFEDLLRKTRAAGRTALLIVDEAQRLDQALLEEIRLLSNIEDPDQKLLNVFFVGQEEFLDIIADPQNRALKQRITINYHLETLSREETEQLVRHRLKVAGATREVFTPDAYPGIFTFSLGAPRLINILCDHALLTGFVHNVDTIGADIITECTQDMMLPGEQAAGLETAPPAEVPETVATPKPTAATVTAGMMLQNAPPPIKRKRWSWAAAAMLLLTIGIAFLWQQGWQPLREAWNMARVVPSTPAPEAITTPEPATSTPPDTPAEPPRPARIAPAVSLPAPPQATSVAEGLDTAEDNETPSTPAVPDQNARLDARHDAANTEPTPDRPPPQPLPETSEVEPLMGNAVPEPQPAEDIAARDQVDRTATGSDRATPAATASAAVAGIDEQTPGNRIATAPDVKDPGVIQATDDSPAPPLPAPPATVPPEPAEAVADGAARPPGEPLPGTVRPHTSPPAAPVITARTEPETSGPSPLVALSKPTSPETTVLDQELPAGATLTAPSPLPYPTEDKIRDFIHSYRKAYESRDIDRFRLFFAEDAIEQSRPFSDALPVYQRNFNALDALEYDIALKTWEEDEATGKVTLQGLFDIRYRMPGSAWRNTQGKISMDLVETGGVYRIKRLDYWKQ